MIPINKYSLRAQDVEGDPKITEVIIDDGPAMSEVYFKLDGQGEKLWFYTTTMTHRLEKLLLGGYRTRLIGVPVSRVISVESKIEAYLEAEESYRHLQNKLQGRTTPPSRAERRELRKLEQALGKSGLA